MRIFACLLSFTYFFSGNAQTWEATDTLPAPGRDDAIAFSIGNTGYTVTGNHGGFSESNNCFGYDPVAGNWFQCTAFPGTPRQYAAVFVLDEKAFLIGGISENNVPLNDVWRFDPAAAEWLQLNDFPGPARWSAFAFATPAHGYFGTGSTLTGLLQDCWQYEPAADRWTQLADFPGGTRREAVAFSVGEKGFAGLGYSVFGGTDYRADLYEWNELTASWSAMPDFPGGGRSYANAVGTNAYGYVGTGLDAQGGFHADCYRFQPQQHTWAAMPDLPETIKGMSAFAIGDTPYFLTGITAGYIRRSAMRKLTEAPVKTPGPVVVYPNPSSGKAVVKAKNGARVELFTAEGKRYAETIAGPQETAWFENLPAGAYEVRITTNGAIAAEKLIVR